MGSIYFLTDSFNYTFCYELTLISVFIYFGFYPLSV